jgi:hypothetical protein
MQKLSKLAAATSKKRILLLEKDSVVGSPEEIGVAIERHRAQFPELQEVDEVWVINTAAWPREDYTPSYLVWPRRMARAWRLTKNLASRRA